MGAASKRGVRPQVRAMLRLTRKMRGMKIPLPEFSKSRFEQRYNLNTEDKIKLANWNVMSILLTFVPVAYMMNANYYTSPYTDRVIKALDAGMEPKINYDKRLFANCGDAGAI